MTNWIPVLAAMLLWAPAPSSHIPAAEVRVDALLSAMGGRDLWARTTFVHVDATHWEVAVATPFRNQIWNDFSAPRVRIEASIANDPRVRAMNGDTGWRRRNGEVFALTPEQLASEHAWWESNVYRTLHRLARRDSTLTVRLVGSDRLEVFREDGRRLNWLVLNAAGEPVRFGTWDNDAGSVFGPLTTSPGGLRHWRWGTSADGSFRFEIQALRGYERAPDDVSFEK